MAHYAFSLHKITVLSQFNQCIRLIGSFILLSSLLATFGATAQAQTVTAVEIGSGFLDDDKVLGPRWTRVNFSPLVSSTHTIRVAWDSDADIRFSLFQILDAPSPNDKVKIASHSGTNSPIEWTGPLLSSEQYYLGVWAASGSGNFTATLEGPPPQIVSQPIDLTVTEGEDATFDVTATGSDTLNYQWSTNGVDIAGATSSSVTISAVTLAENGTTYSVLVTDGYGSITSDNATLTVGAAALQIVAPPADLTVTEGQDATFSVTATGSGTLSYQWSANGQPITGATENTLSISAVSLADSGTVYLVQITDGINSVGYASATLTVEAAPLEILTQPTDLTVIEGEDATFAVTATGSGTLNYQWSANGVDIAGATSSTVTTSAVTLAETGTSYSVLITDDNGSITSNFVTLTVEEAPVPVSIDSQPTNLSIFEGEDAIFSVMATGEGTLTYQWFANGVAITGATTDTLLVSSVSSADDANVYRVDIADDNGSISSDNAILEVIQLPVTSTIIAQGTLDSDKNAGPSWVRLDFNSLASAVHTITVSWDSNADVRFRVFEIDDTIISPVIKESNPGVWSGDLVANEQYYIALWSKEGIANYTATIEATVPIEITSQPSDLIVTEGDDAFFVVEADGSGVLTYQWLADGNPINGETANSLTVFAASLAEHGTEYSLEISNGYETVTSDIATLTVNEPLALGLFSQEADLSAWMLEGPAPTLDYQAGADTNAWGRILLRVGDNLLVGGDFTGIKPNRSGPVTARPFLASFDAVTGQPTSTFQVPFQVDSVVRSLVLSPSGNHVYVGGDFGFLILDATTGALVSDVSVTQGNNPGRVFDIEVTNTDVYIGGNFNNVDNTFRANIARLSLTGELDTTWSPQVTSGFNAGRAAPVQALAVSPSGDTVYVGGNFRFIDGTHVDMTPQNKRISLLAVSAIDETVQPERFSADIGGNTKALQVHDIAVTDDYVVVAWGGPNYLTFHSLAGDRLQQYRAKGDVQALQIVGNHIFVGHHGEFFGSRSNSIPPEAVESINPDIFNPFKFHSFRIDDPSFLPEQAWEIGGAFGVWGIAAAEDSIWIAGEMFRAGSNERPVDGLVRFPALP